MTNVRGRREGRGMLDAAGTFFCNGCSTRYPAACMHSSGFCTVCIDRGRRYWEETLAPAELEQLLVLWRGPDVLGVAA